MGICTSVAAGNQSPRLARVQNSSKQQLTLFSFFIANQ
jgi:hypothetical protein